MNLTWCTHTVRALTSDAAERPRPSTWPGSQGYTFQTTFGSDIAPTLERERLWRRLRALEPVEVMEATGNGKGHCAITRARTWTPYVSSLAGTGPRSATVIL
jgi:hypothetical protein